MLGVVLKNVRKLNGSGREVHDKKKSSGNQLTAKEADGA